MKRKILIITGALLTMFFAGCEKSGLDIDNISNEITIAEDEVFALKSVESADRDINAARFAGNFFKGGMMISGPHLYFGKHFPDCATVTVNDTEGGFPKEVIIDYAEGCQGRGGMKRTGVVTIYMEDTITNAGAVYTVSYEDVTMGNRQVERSATLTNEGLNDDGNWVISSQSVMTSTVESEGATVVITREYSHQKVWLDGFETPEIEDDQFLRSGGGSITVNGEVKFERTISEPLLIDRTCLFPLSGIIQITRGGELMEINFGEGDCDNWAEVTKDGVTEEMELMGGRFKNGFKRHNHHMKQHKGWW